MTKLPPYQIIGLMSGTSLDGLDIAMCEFNVLKGEYTYSILAAQTIAYSDTWKNKLHAAKNLSAENYFVLNAEYGGWIAECVNTFIQENNFKPYAIASHGHTVFHQPHLGFSTQIGCGATLAAKTNLITVCDFRSLDVALGGQGAPLVPIGDALLFKKYQACLNLGGIANISFDDESGKRLAYDVCEANMLLNYVAQKLGMAYDEGGQIAKSGEVIPDLFEKFQNQLFYKIQGAKSLGREWFDENCVTLVETYASRPKDVLATAVEHIASIIANDLEIHQLKNALVTGGGALNHFLIERIKSKTSCVIQLPEMPIIQFKEALIFAFLGYLRLHQKTNTLCTVTAALRNSIGGAVYLGK
jgi:anhydro-N-acetylmuramic acid kinase